MTEQEFFIQAIKGKFICHSDEELTSLVNHLRNHSIISKDFKRGNGIEPLYVFDVLEPFNFCYTPVNNNFKYKAGETFRVVTRIIKGNLT